MAVRNLPLEIGVVFPPLPVVPSAIVSLIAASVSATPVSRFSAIERQEEIQPTVPTVTTTSHESSTLSKPGNDFYLKGIRMHEMSAFVILIVCLILTAALVIMVGFYCLIHCWKHHKHEATAAHRRALVQSSIVSTAIDEMVPPSESRLLSRRPTLRRMSIFGGLGKGNRSPCPGRAVKGSYQDIRDISALNGKLPQIRISLSSAGQSSPEEGRSIYGLQSEDSINVQMSKVSCQNRSGSTKSVGEKKERNGLSTGSSSILPPWMEGRNSVGHTPQTPGSPISFTSFNGYKEPLLGIDKPPAGSFWQRLAGRSPSASGDNGSALIKMNMENGHFDDREIDDRSVLHYELGSYEKTKTNCFKGTLTFSLRYDFIHRVLMLHVIKANHLFGQDKADKPNPYVKMYLLPERRNHCKTRIIKKSADPDFNEMFSFDVTYNNLPSRMLQFTIYDFDRFSRHGLIGNVIMRDLFDKSELLQWTEYTMQIVGSQEKNDFGDLLLYLAYSVQKKKLYVTVAKAYNLRPMDITGASDPYVRCEQIFQRKRIKLRKTSIKRANLNPVYHECLEFDLDPKHIDETNMLIQVMDWDRIGRDDLLGCCVLGKESPTKEGRQQWEQVFSCVRGGSENGVEQDLDESPIPRAVGQWHSILGEVPDGFRNIPKANKKEVQKHRRNRFEN
ncbi:hypothetical protein FO519_001200 [Halicephalobus sp. NKZ332]|nr:hypothetical protein FO519_001200 [Halicephalobus sp. NKZ332]